MVGIEGGVPAAASADDGAETTALLARAQGESSGRDAAKIEKAGHDFEAILLGSWLQGAEQSFGAAPGGDDDADSEDSGHDSYLGMAMQQLGGAMASSGGIGLGHMIVEHLEQSGGSRQET